MAFKWGLSDGMMVLRCGCIGDVREDLRGSLITVGEGTRMPWASWSWASGTA